MTHFDTAANFIEASKRVSSDDELADAFLAGIHELGFDTFACIALIDQDNMPDEFVNVNRYAPAWVEHYTDQHYLQIDPTLANALSSTVPFRWDERVDMKKLSAKQKQLFMDAADFGISQGFTVPIHSRVAYSASVSIVGDNEDIDPNAYNSVHLMSVYLHETALRLCTSKSKKEKAKLTGRERECLKWVAMGKSDWEIGEILGISKNTVHFHIENAKEKFETYSRVQAVTEALLTNNIAI